MCRWGMQMQTTCLINNLYLEYIKDFQNSVIRKQPNKEWAKDLNIEETFHQRKYANGQ